jgi:DNA-binding CsgD family transcriptional regulator/tetratricopeptide (TPR) repeat protein
MSPQVNALLEREAPLSHLNAAARRVARGGPGEVVLLRGEAGVGKTALLARFADQLQPRLRVLRGWCDPLGAPPPLGPLTDALSGLDAAAGAALAAAVDSGDTAKIYRQLLAALGDGSRWVWVIEDAHWGDGATLDLVRFLARRITELRLLLVISFRDDELAPTHPLAVTLGDLANCARVNRIKLGALSLSAVAILAAGSGVNAAALYQVSGGNPFFVTEVLAAGPDALSRKTLPRSVSEAVCGRLARLSAKGREVAHAVAVCGPRADVALLEKVCPEARTALHECLGAGVLICDGALVGFRHELARLATRAQIADFDRVELHRRALTALADDPNALAALAFHADEANETQAAVRYGIAAAERAVSLGANREAANLYALALRHADTACDNDRVVWLERHAFTCYLSGEAEPAVASLREAITLRRKLSDHLAEGDDLRWLSSLLQPLGRGAEAIDAAHTSLRLLEGLGPSPQLAWSLINMAHISALSLDPACADYAARAHALGRELHDTAVDIRARGYTALTAVFTSGTGWDELETVWREALSTPGLEEHAAVLGVLISWYAVLRCELSLAEGYLADALRFCDDRDLGMFSSLLNSAATLAALHRGDWDLAAGDAEQILTRPELSPQHRVLPMVTLTLVRARRGQPPTAPPPDAAEDGGQPGELVHLGVVWAARAEVAWLAGDDERAVAEAHAGLAAAGEHADPWLLGSLRRWIHLAGGPIDAVHDGAPTPFDLEIAGQWRSAADEWAGRGCSYDAALSLLGGDVYAVKSALEAFRRLGAKAAARRAQQRLGALRERAPRTRQADKASDPHALTGRQRQVFDLLAAGLSNPEIATELHISPKTVGHHVEAILAKLGVQNRTQAVAYALQHQADAQSH